MVLKRQLRDGGEEGSSKRPHLVSTILKGLNYGRTLQETVPRLEPIIRKWVQEAVERALDQHLSPSYNHVECSGSRNLQLQFQGTLPQKLFTGNRVLSEEKTPIKVALYDSSSRKIITSGPLSSLKVTIVVLDGDFGPDDREDWTTKEFDNKIVKNREGRRPLVTGELTVNLHGGVGTIGEICFTDNSSWIRSGKFRLGAKVNANSDEISIREAMSNAFKVKDHRGESYQKHYPPLSDDEVWRLEKIAKDGASHKKLTQFGINNVGEFLRFYFTNQSRLRHILNVSKKMWETIIGHATTCTLDDKKYMYRTAEGTGLLFNSIFKVVGVTFDGQNYDSLNALNEYHRRIVEELKQHAYKNMKEWVSVSEPSISGYPMLLASPAADSFTNPSLGLHDVSFQQHDQHETEINTDHPTMSRSCKTEVEQDDCPFEVGETSNPMQSFNPMFRNSFGVNSALGGLYVGGHHAWPSTSNYMGSELSTDDIPIDDNFQVESSPWHGNGFFVDPTNLNFGIISSNSGIHIPRNRTPKTRWCKVLAAVKWRILVKQIVADRELNRFYNYF
ncbi:hypothetical protein CDL12_05429 [Handroanthus impetiginosus]|uniref:Uncharacterized protein n=1 Tax=Handroanthus impetiginosus TaxID=429701 RepID=A0A2G9HX00_9LAMI|nr:hypothetical protein CDL12_05429 [Handroanthus impetiginosus]